MGCSATLSRQYCARYRSLCSTTPCEATSSPPNRCSAKRSATEELVRGWNIHMPADPLSMPSCARKRRCGCTLARGVVEHFAYLSRRPHCPGMEHLCTMFSVAPTDLLHQRAPPAALRVGRILLAHRQPHRADVPIRGAPPRVWQYGRLWRLTYPLSVRETRSQLPKRRDTSWSFAMATPMQCKC